MSFKSSRWQAQKVSLDGRVPLLQRSMEAPCVSILEIDTSWFPPLLHPTQPESRRRALDFRCLIRPTGVPRGDSLRQNRMLSGCKGKPFPTRLFPVVGGNNSILPTNPGG